MIELIYTSNDGVKHFMAVDATVDDLPTDVRTGSDCLMVDTGERYVFHQGTGKWYLQKSEGGGGGEAVVETREVMPEIWVKILSGEFEENERIDIEDDILTGLCSSLFNGHTELRNATFNNARTVGKLCFCNATYIERLSLPSATLVKENAIMHCISLTDLYLPVCQHLEGYAIYNCFALQEIILPMCETVGEWGITHHTNLHTIDILGGGTGFADHAFSSNFRLKNLIVRNELGVVPAGESILEHLDYEDLTPAETDARIYVPAALVNGYKAASGWSAYADFIVPIEGSQFEQSGGVSL